MKFPRIIQAVYAEPWLITPAAHGAIRSLLENRLSESYRAGMFDFEEDEEEQGILRVADGVAEIAVEGTILRKATALERMCGAIGTEQVETALRDAMQSADVRGLFLDIDSPGGTVGGVPELGALVAECAKSKRVVAYTGGQMCSAAYWLAAGADEIIASESAEVGSIGVYMPWADQSKRYEQAGVKVEVIRNEGADLKGMGYPGTSLSDAQRAELQKGVDRIAAMFHAHVQAARGTLEPDTLRGQAFLAAEAKDRRLIDAVMTRADALASFKRTIAG